MGGDHRVLLHFHLSMGVFALGSPGGTTGKEHACQCRRCKRLGFDPWVRNHALEEGMATHPSILAWRIPRPETGGLQSMGLHRVGHD